MGQSQVGMCGSSRLDGTAPASRHWKQQSITWEKKKYHDDFIIQITIILTLHLKHFK